MIENIPWQIFLIVVPLITGVFSFLFPERAKLFGLLPAFFIPITVFPLLIRMLRQGLFHYKIGGWGAPVGIELFGDGLSLVMLILTALVGSLISIYAAGYFPRAKGRGQHGVLYQHKENFFWPLWNFLWAALNALYLSGDIFNIYVTLELIGLSAVALIALEGGTITLKASLRYLLVSLLGSLCYLLGIAVLYSTYATVDITLLAQAIASQEQTTVPVSLALISIGLMLKIGIFPFHFWLPPAHANALAPVSAILSALVVKAPFYLLIRLWYFVFATFSLHQPGQFLAILGSIAIIWGSIRAIQQVRLKLLVAYSTVAQLGYLFLLFPLLPVLTPEDAAWNGTLLYAFSHGCAKAAMFLAAGTIQYAAGNDFIREIEHVHRQTPLSLFAFALAGVSLMGLPPTGGFAGKWMLLSSTFRSGHWVYALILTCGSLLTAIYIFRVLRHVFARVPETIPEQRSVPPVLEWSALFLALFAVGTGLIPQELTKILSIGNIPLFPE